MKANSLEILENAKLPPEQARAILRVMETEIADHDGGLVAKGELHAVELKLHALELKLERGLGELKAEIRTMGTRLVLWMFGMIVALGGLLFAALGRPHP